MRWPRGHRLPAAPPWVRCSPGGAVVRSWTSLSLGSAISSVGSLAMSKSVVDCQPQQIGKYCHPCVVLLRRIVSLDQLGSVVRKEKELA
ncbi:hypothetical protein Micbo1qcDRAFT_168461, partial [Microdochium bolleyi]